MSDQYGSYSRPRHPARTLKIVLLAVLITFAATLLLLRFSTHGLLDRLAATLTGRTLAFNTSTPVVVDKIRQLNRLETISYSLDTVVEGSSANPTLSSVLPATLYGDRILMVVHGQAIAGVDLAKLTPQNVVIQNKSISVTLPPAELFLTTLDNAHTRVYSRSTGWLSSPDQNLESATRTKAEQQLTQAALADGILDTAHKNACASITLMLSGLGFQQVTVN